MGARRRNVVLTVVAWAWAVAVVVCSVGGVQHVDAAFGCVDHTGAVVDYWFTYKLPADNGWWVWTSKLPKPKYFGLTAGKVGKAYAFVPALYAPNFPPLKTHELTQSTSGAKWLHYQDHQGGSESDAHARGTLALDAAGKEGFWMVHSLPDYPYSNVNPFSPTVMASKSCGQHFMCVSFDNSAGHNADTEYRSAFPNTWATPPAVGAINWKTKSVSEGIENTLRVRRSRSWYGSDWVGISKCTANTKGQCPHLATEDEVRAMPSGFYRTKFKSTDRDGTGKVDFEILTRRQDVVADLWVEAISPYFAALDTHATTFVQTFKCGSTVRSASSCCGRSDTSHALVDPVAFTSSSAGKHGSCPSNCLISVSHKLAQMNHDWQHAAAKAEYGLFCPLNSDVIQVDEADITKVNSFDSSTPVTKGKQIHPQKNSVTIEVKPWSGHNHDHAKVARIETASTEWLCAADVNRHGGKVKGEGVGGGNHMRGGAALCTTAMGPAAQVIAEMTTTHDACPMTAALGAFRNGQTDGGPFRALLVDLHSTSTSTSTSTSANRDRSGANMEAAAAAAAGGQQQHTHRLVHHLLERARHHRTRRHRERATVRNFDLLPEAITRLEWLLVLAYPEESRAAAPHRGVCSAAERHAWPRVDHDVDADGDGGGGDADDFVPDAALDDAARQWRYTVTEQHLTLMRDWTMWLVRDSPAANVIAERVSTLDLEAVVNPFADCTTGAIHSLTTNCVDGLVRDRSVFLRVLWDVYNFLQKQKQHSQSSQTLQLNGVNSGNNGGGNNQQLSSQTQTQTESHPTTRRRITINKNRWRKKKELERQQLLRERSQKYAQPALMRKKLEDKIATKTLPNTFAPMNLNGYRKRSRQLDDVGIKV